MRAPGSDTRPGGEGDQQEKEAKMAKAKEAKARRIYEFLVICWLDLACGLSWIRGVVCHKQQGGCLGLSTDRAREAVQAQGQL